MPILVFFLALMRVITARWMWRNLRYSILAIFVLAAIVTPTTDILNMCPFCCTDGRALRNEHRSGLAGEPLTDAEDVMSPIMILLDVKLRRRGGHAGRIYS